MGITAAELATELLSGSSMTVLGAPGTGKTALVADTYACLTRERASRTDEVVVLTPTRDLASWLRDRLPQEAHRVRSGPAARSLHSLAFGLVSAHAAVRDGAGTKFLSGADQDALLAELLAGYRAGRVSPPRWPVHLGPEVRTTTAFRDQLREVLNRVMELGFTPAQVQAAGLAHDRGDWAAAAEVLQDYEDQIAVPVFGGVDTAAVLAEAASVLRDEHVAGTVAGQSWSFSGEIVPRFVLVDAAQDLSDAAVAVLSGLRDLGAVLAVCASPDTGTQGFRGSTGSIVSLVTRPGAPVIAGPAGHRLVVLDPSAEGVRGAGAVAAVGQDFARRISPDLVLGHVPRTPAEAPAGRSGAAAVVHASAAEQSRAISGLLRSWHHDTGLDWSEMAVIGRTAGTAAALRQELGYLGIPVAASELPLAADPATAPLLHALASSRLPSAHFARLVKDFLTGPYFRVDALALRGLEREVSGLLPDCGSASGDEDPSWEPGTSVLSRAVKELPAEALPEPLRTLSAVLSAAADAADLDPHSAVWRVWQATGVARAWRARALSGPADPVNDRLDAVLRLISLAEKLSEREALNAQSFAFFVLDQEFAQDSLAAQRTQSVLAVGSSTALAHRSFSRVIVVDINEGSWPDPRIRGSLFGTDDLLRVLTGGEVDPDAAGAHARRRRATIIDEGRLFLSALSRAEDELVLMALDDGQTSPSAFFDTVAAHPAVAALPVAGRRSGQDVAIVGERSGRAGSGDEVGPTRTESLPVSVRQAAATARARLVRAAAQESSAAEEWVDLLNSLARAGIEEAKPETWTAWQQVTSNAPLLDAADIAPISPSEAESFANCALRWFLTRHGGRSASSRAQSLGTLIHRIAETHPRGGLPEMLDAFEEGFTGIEFAAQWERDREQQRGRQMVAVLDEYLRQTSSKPGILDVAVEVAVDTTVEAGAPGAPWRISGRVDRLEILQPAGRRGPELRPVDLKTGKNPVSRDDARSHPQLGVYQVALEAGGAVLPDGSLVSGEPGGAELVYLNGKKAGLRDQPALGTAAEPAWAHELVGSIADGMRSAVFAATPSPDSCRSCPVKSSCPAFAGAPTAGGDE